MDYLKYIYPWENPTEIITTRDVKFYVHDQEHTVKATDYTPETTLNMYLRKRSCLTGTKVMCREGGCGCCVVTATFDHPVTNKRVTLAINSCLVSIFSCHGWTITTVEGVGNPKDGYHKIQEALVKFNGTQCGFCSSGMVMTMYELYKRDALTMAAVERSFGGNLCRCTGYRSILAAFKSLCTDADPAILGHYPDIEDTVVCRRGSDCKRDCNKPCHLKDEPFNLEMGESKWYKVYTVKDIAEVLSKWPNLSYMLVSGNTAKGVYKPTKTFDLYIDISAVKELREYKLNNNSLELGANMTLTETMELFSSLGEQNKKFSYLKKMAHHINLIAHVPVRNIGSLAGNLCTKNQHNEFPSDVFLISETVGAVLTIVGLNNREENVKLEDFLTYNMHHKIMKRITLPALDDQSKYQSYKIIPRNQNAHAMVNAGFLFKYDPNYKVLSARIVYGGINPKFVHAKKTEALLIGKNLFDNSTLQDAYATLDQELKPDYVLPDPTPIFRKQLAISLFYKFVLAIAPANITSVRNKSGGTELIRPISRGVQDYETNTSMYPIGQPIHKLEARAQVSGQAEYIMDMPDRPCQLYAAFVLTKAVAYTKVRHVDASKALAMEGVVAYYDKTDIPGENTFTPKSLLFPVNEEIFCTGVIKFYFQPVGMIVATTQEIAEKAAELVRITYAPGVRKPLFTVRDVLKANAVDRIAELMILERKRTGGNVKHIIKGSMDYYMQYHFHMETQCCNVIPKEDGLDLYPATQTMDASQHGAAAVLKMEANKINVKVRRLGGAYGAKISRNGMVSCAASLAAYKLQKPVKMWLPFNTNMDVVGKRCPVSADYEVAVDDKGIIQYLTATMYTDFGIGGNENASPFIMSMMANAYNYDTFQVKIDSVKTDKHANTWCRAPGSAEGLTALESIMEHVACSINMDPMEFRLANLNKTKHPLLETFLRDLLSWANIEQRKKDVAVFNKANRWMKRGLSVVPMVYFFEMLGNYNVVISVYQIDGSVAIAHGGIEMGQGINTKAAQACAYSLGIPLDKVSIKPSNNLCSPNCLMTGGSLTSEAVCFAVLEATQTLKDRMKPIKEKMSNPTWSELVRQCYAEDMELIATAMFSKHNPKIHNYTVYGVCAAEVQVDILTGNHQVLRVDLLEDTGNSMNPDIDIGQIEGAFIMGLGYHTLEELIYDEKGELKTDRTWNYKIPGALDIPIDFRIKLPANNPNPLGVLKSKALAEPPLCLAMSVPLAIRSAVGSARVESDPKASKFYPFDGPTTVENAYLNSLLDYKQYTL